MRIYPLAYKKRPLKRAFSFYCIKNYNLYLLSSGLYRRYRNCADSGIALSSQNNPSQTITAGEELHLAPKNIYLYFYYTQKGAVCQPPFCIFFIYALSNQIKKILPSPTWLSTPYSKPCRSSTPLTIDKPKPVPCTGRLCASFER